MEVEAQPLERVHPADRYADGTWTKMNGRREYLVPALPFGILKKMRSKVAEQGEFKKGSLPSDEQLSTIVEILHAALAINYPDMTIDQASMFVTTESFPRIFNAVMQIAGLEAKKPGEAKPATET